MISTLAGVALVGLIITFTVLRAVKRWLGKKFYYVYEMVDLNASQSLRINGCEEEEKEEEKVRRPRKKCNLVLLDAGCKNSDLELSQQIHLKM